MLKHIARLTIGLMQAFEIPVSINPFWYRTLRSGRNLYRPFFEPRREDEVFESIWQQVKDDSTSLVDAAYMLFSFARLAAGQSGEIWECGVYKGATAALLANAVGPSHMLRLFDTFSGMPEQSPDMDSFKIGSLSDTSIDRVRENLAHLGNVKFHQGRIPQTFDGLESTVIAFAHVDVDQYETTKSCCEFIFPRLAVGGMIIIDDYGRPGTPGARIAVDEFLGPFGLRPVVLNTGQAVIMRLGV